MPKRVSFFKRLARAIGILIILGSVAFAVYYLFIRPWHLRWGATDAEVERIMPGDDEIKDPTYLTTRAVTTNASSEKIWPWLPWIKKDS